MKKAVLVLKDSKAIRLMAKFHRSEIIRLLSERPMTETQLSKLLGLTKGAIGYHLHPLRDAGLIEIDRYETEEHGISKYYSTVATLFIVDPDCIPEDVRRYFLETEIVHLEGMLSALKLHDKIPEISSEDLEELAKAMLRQLKIVGEKHAEEQVQYKNSESLKVKIYAEALDNLVKQEKYAIFRKTPTC